MSAGWAPETRSHYLHKQKTYQARATSSSSDTCKRAFTSSPSRISSNRGLCWHVGWDSPSACTLKRLDIIRNSGLTSLEYLSGEHPPSMESLWLESCGTLASLPNEPQVYRSLWNLNITGCPAIKKLPRCLQQQLGSIDDYYKQLDARYDVMALKPKTWKEIPRLVRERRQAAERARSATMQE